MGICGKCMNEIIRIARHRMGSDGEGVSTLVAFWGCPLQCNYCINDFCHDVSVKKIKVSPEELLRIVKIDDIYFRMSNGGIVFGGGEPLLNSKYIKHFIVLSPKEWSFRIETSLNIQWHHVERLLPYIDQWIIDIKDINSDIYKKYTKLDNHMVLHNIEKLSRLVGKEKILFRVPYILGYNNISDIEKSCTYLEKMGEIEKFEYRVTKQHI